MPLFIVKIASSILGLFSSAVKGLLLLFKLKNSEEMKDRERRRKEEQRKEEIARVIAEKNEEEIRKVLSE